MLFHAKSRTGRVLKCPRCGAAGPTGAGGRDRVVTCPACGTKASRAEWMSGPGGGPAAGRADQPPPATRIVRESTGGGTVWHIPARGKFGFLMVFGVFWCLITAAVSGSFLLAFLGGREIEGNMPEWALIPFFGIFWVIGLVTLYLGVREKWMRHRVTVAAGELVLRREMFGRSREQRLPVAEIRSVEQKEFYQQNYQPVHGIEIKASRAKVRFGSVLTPEEKAWLVADLQESVFGPRPAPAVPASRPAQPGGAGFSVEIPDARKHLWPLALVLMAVGTVCVVVALQIAGRGQSDSGGPRLVRLMDAVFNLAELGFQTAFILAGAAMVIGGVVLFVKLLRSRGSIRKLEGNATEIALRTYRHGRVWDERTFPRGEVADLRASVSGSSNGRPMKRLELIAGDKVIPLARWIDGAAADALVAEVRGRW